MKKRVILAAVVALMLIAVFSASVFAAESGKEKRNHVLASAQTKKKQEKKAKTKFKTGIYKVNGRYCYFENGKFKKATGIAKCVSNGKWFYVEKGLLKKATGVAKNLKTGKWGYVKNGVFNTKTGLARLISNKRWVYVRNGVLESNPKKIQLTSEDENAGRQEILCMVYARALFSQIVKPEMTKAEKLKACFLYLEPLKHYYYLMTRIPYYTGSDSAIVYTLDMIREQGSTCHGFASLFAYLAKLCGYDDVYYCWSSYHGWAEIGGLIYDPVFMGEPHLTVVYATPYEQGRVMGLGTDYYEVGRYEIPNFK